MTSTVILRSPTGMPLFSIQVKCNGEPCRGISLYDAGTEKNVVRFVAKVEGDLQFVLNNVGLTPASIFDVVRTDLGPDEKWGASDIVAVNHINCIEWEDEYILERDESTGCKIRVEAYRENQKLIRDPQVVAQKLRRTKWQMTITPTHNISDLRLGSWFLTHVLDGETELIIKMRSGNFTLGYGPKTTVRTLKEKLQKQLGISVSDQELVSAVGKKLSNDDRIKDLNVEEVFLSSPDSVGPWVWCYVETPKNGTVFCTMKSSDTVEELMVQVYMELRDYDLYPYYMFSIFKDGSEGPLCWKKTLMEYGVPCLATLRVKEHGSLKITVKVMNGENVEICAHRSELVSILKKKICFKAGIVVNYSQELFNSVFGLFGNGEELVNEKPISDYESLNFEELTLKEKGSMSVNVCFEVPWKCNETTVFADPVNKLHDLKEKIKLKINSSVKSSRYRFYHKDNKLDEEKSLLDLGISNGSTLLLRREHDTGSGMVVNIATATKAFDFRVDPFTKIRDLQKLIYEEDEGLHPSIQSLLYNCERIPYDSSLADCNVVPNSTIEVYAQQCGGGWSVESPPLVPDDVCAVAEGPSMIDDSCDSDSDMGVDDMVVGKIVKGAAVAKPRSHTANFIAYRQLSNDLQFEIYVDPLTLH